MSGVIHDFTTKCGTIAAIRYECRTNGLDMPEQQAYVLATVDHETNGTFKPVTEAYWLKDPDAYLKKHHPDYYPYYGRGFVQLTWSSNYKLYSKILKTDLLNNPKKVLEPNIALFILCHGFKNGTFTGKKLEDYINHDRVDYINARKCINGNDKAMEIAQLTKKYL